MSENAQHHAVMLTIPDLRPLYSALKCLTALCLLLFSVSCTSVLPNQEKAIYFNQLVIRNLSHSDITDLTIRVDRINGVFSCSQILSGSFCSNGFRTRQYQRNAISIDWSMDGEFFKRGPLKVAEPAQTAGVPYIIEVNLLDGGEMRVSFIAASDPAVTTH